MSQDPETQTTTQAAIGAVAPFEPQPIVVERVRFSGERAAADAVRSDPWLRDLAVAADARGRSDSSRTRRQLLSHGARLTEGMAPDLFAAARWAAEHLGVDGVIEIHQITGTDNPAIHLIEEPILLEVRSRLMALLDGPSTVAAMGRQLGHHLAHGHGSRDGALGLVIKTAMEDPGVPQSTTQAVSSLALCRAITADRFGLLACRDLSAALRLEMAETTGLAAEVLTWDTTAYLEQCKALIESTLDALAQTSDTKPTFPEHGLRAWALWMFSESDVYQAITGQGPGTRDIEEVDELVARIIGASPVEGFAETALELDPIPEVHECALASAALVALADGDLSDGEAMAIEKVFATLVGDWQRYLVWDNALEAFGDTAPVVAAAGPAVQRSVFQVLVNVLAADADVEGREIGMVCSIGDALQAGELFRALLGPVLKTFGDAPRDLSEYGEVIPMPARSAETETALEVFLQGIRRRGGGEATLRRMFRLLGDRDGTVASENTLSRVMRTVGLRPLSPLDDTPLDQPIQLGLTAAARASQYEDEDTSRLRVPVVKPDSARQRLTRGLSRLRESLVSGDGRSPSVRLRETRTGRSFDLHVLESMSLGHGERTLTLVQAGKPARIVDGREVGVHSVAEEVSKQLVALNREAVARHEQTGARDLYVGTPFLTGIIDGYLVRAPLVLYPYELERSEARSFQLMPRQGDARIVNQALLRLVFSKKGVPFPEELGERLDRAADDGVEAVRQLLADEGLRPRSEGDDLLPFLERAEEFDSWVDGRIVLEPCAVLGFFPQSTSDMIADYDDLLTAVADPRVPLADKLGAAGPLLPVDLREELVVSEEWNDEREDQPIIPVVPADPSQGVVLSLARKKRALVVDGPPGTGKSQVIVNLVADALSRGETVAVVCEKRAALDVVAQRLEQLGLRHLLAVVHDVHDDRRSLYDQVVARLGEGPFRHYDEVRAERATEDLRNVLDQLVQRRGALMSALGKDRPSLGQLHLLAASFGIRARSIELDPELVQMAPRALHRLADRVGREAPHADLHQEGSVWRAPKGGPARPSLADAREDLLAKVQDVLRNARSTAAALDALEGQQSVKAVDVEAAADALRAAIATKGTRSDRSRRELMVGWLDRGDDPALEGMVRNLKQTWKNVGQWQKTAPEPVAFELDPEGETALAVVRSWGSSFFRWFSMAWWRARGALRRMLTVQWPAAAASGVGADLVDRIDQRTEGSKAWAALRKLLAVLEMDPALPDTASATVWVERIEETFEATRPLVQHEEVLRKAAVWPEGRGGLENWDGLLQDRLALIEAAKEHREAFSPARAYFPWMAATPNHDAVSELHEAWAVDAPRVVTSDHNLKKAVDLFDDARDLVQRLADARGPSDASDWADALEHSWAIAAIEQVERRFPQTRILDRVSVEDVEQAEAKLAELVDRRAHFHVQAIVDRCDRVPLLTEARPEKGRTQTPLQKSREQMLREASKRRFILSLRSFVRQFTHRGLMDLLPVWLLSPETMAVLFPGRPVFDVVVVDEASQCTVEKGLPALMRGHRAVIAGDDKQMPPTSFFELRGVTTDEDELGNEETIEADALTAESLLVLARERCVHEGLRWHYRCLREELIAFSNHAMYGGDLFTIPSTATGAADPALRWEAVHDAAYDQGANQLEAERVVELIAEVLAADEPDSVGVVTFNVQQRQAILDALDRRGEQDAEFARRYATAEGHAELDRRPFVKNLEAVQGDERDVIIFSLAHAPVERKNGDRYVPARFGPLGQVGGERRLNVAVSRAKKECIVVASFEPSMLSVAETKHTGPKLLKAFLQYAWDLTHGRRLQAEKILDRVRHGSLGDLAERGAQRELQMPPLSAQLAERLDGLGVAYDLEVGTSGFRVPLAIIDPDDPRSYKVAVVTDVGLGTTDVLEAHLHEPRVLAARGWRVVRVDSREWHRDPDAVVERVLAEVRA